MDWTLGNTGLNLEDAYGTTLERIKAQGRKKSRLGMTALMWVCHSERPLEVQELCHALAVKIGTPDRKICPPLFLLKYSRRFHIFNTTTTLDVSTRRVWFWKGLRKLEVEAMFG